MAAMRGLVRRLEEPRGRFFTLVAVIMCAFIMILNQRINRFICVPSAFFYEFSCESTSMDNARPRPPEFIEEARLSLFLLFQLQKLFFNQKDAVCSGA